MVSDSDFLQYDKSNPLSIEIYSQKMIGKTFRQILEEDEMQRPGLLCEDGVRYGASDVSVIKRNKGNLGQIIEESFFHYACNSDSRPDFYESGVELKVTPYRKNQNGSLSAKERLILTMIDYCQIVNEKFEDSHVWKKSKLILLVYYLYEKNIKCNLDYRIDYCMLFTPPVQDVKIIRHDYYVIVEKIKSGKAHELSEGDTLYLGAATKAATAKDKRKQPFNTELAKPRAFAFKNSYMTYVLNNYIINRKITYEPIVRDEIVESFEHYVIKKIEQYRGYSVKELCAEFGVDIANRPKNLEAILAYRILGITGNHAEEFEKANVVVKTVRIENNNRVKESMSFPAFQFKKLIQEEWENSTFGNYLRETRFLFVIYKFDQDNILRLLGCQFWNIPYDDLETNVRLVWEKTKQIIKNGLQVTMVNGIRRNNLPKASDNAVCHVRPHAKNAQDTYELPNGEKYPKQCFWLNNTYIYEQINDTIKLDPMVRS